MWIWWQMQRQIRAVVSGIVSFSQSWQLCSSSSLILTFWLERAVNLCFRHRHPLAYHDGSFDRAQVPHSGRCSAATDMQKTNTTRVCHISCRKGSYLDLNYVISFDAKIDPYWHWILKAPILHARAFFNSFFCNAVRHACGNIFVVYSCAPTSFWFQFYAPTALSFGVFKRGGGGHFPRAPETGPEVPGHGFMARVKGCGMLFILVYGCRQVPGKVPKVLEASAKVLKRFCRGFRSNYRKGAGSDRVPIITVSRRFQKGAARVYRRVPGCSRGCGGGSIEVI